MLTYSLYIMKLINSFELFYCHRIYLYSNFKFTVALYCEICFHYICTKSEGAQFLCVLFFSGH